jgi:SSS family solute:Na+ symporter
LNCSATVLLLDFYKRFFNPKVGERGSIRFLRLATVVWGILGTALGLVMIRAESALNVWWQISGIFGGGMLGLFILSLLKVRLRLWQGLVSVGVSIAVISWASFMRDSFLNKFGLQMKESWKWAECDLDVVIIGATGTAALMVVACLFGLINRRQANAAETSDSH